jgi:hypothetical protein
MNSPRNRLLRLGLAAAGVLLMGTAPTLGQSLPVPCSAFARTGLGGWKVLAPVMLDIDGQLLGPMVGTTFSAGSMVNGISLSKILDRQCGNR